MQKWEYLFASLARTKDDWAIRYVNGVEVKNWESTKLYDYANKLGDDGWELVDATHTTGSQYFWRLVFKRPK